MVYSKLSFNIHGFALLFCMFNTPKGPSQCILFILTIKLQIHGFAFLFVHSVKHSHVKNYSISWPIRHTVIFSLEILEKIMMNVF